MHDAAFDLNGRDELAQNEGVELELIDGRFAVVVRVHDPLIRHLFRRERRDVSSLQLSLKFRRIF